MLRLTKTSIPYGRVDCLQNIPSIIYMETIFNSITDTELNNNLHSLYLRQLERIVNPKSPQVKKNKTITQLQLEHFLYLINVQLETWKHTKHSIVTSLE